MEKVFNFETTIESITGELLNGIVDVCNKTVVIPDKTEPILRCTHYDGNGKLRYITNVSKDECIVESRVFYRSDGQIRSSDYKGFTKHYNYDEDGSLKTITVTKPIPDGKMFPSNEYERLETDIVRLTRKHEHPKTILKSVYQLSGNTMRELSEIYSDPRTGKEYVGRITKFANSHIPEECSIFTYNYENHGKCRIENLNGNLHTKHILDARKRLVGLTHAQFDLDGNRHDHVATFVYGIYGIQLIEIRGPQEDKYKNDNSDITYFICRNDDGQVINISKASIHDNCIDSTISTFERVYDGVIVQRINHNDNNSSAIIYLDNKRIDENTTVQGIAFNNEKLLSIINELVEEVK